MIHHALVWDCGHPVPNLNFSGSIIRQNKATYNIAITLEGLPCIPRKLAHDNSTCNPRSLCLAYSIIPASLGLTSINFLPSSYFSQKELGHTVPFLRMNHTSDKVDSARGTSDS